MAADLPDHPRILGFKLQSSSSVSTPTTRAFPPCWSWRRGKASFHVGTGPVGNAFVGVAPFRRLLARYPDLPAIVAHMGSLEYGAFGELLADHPGFTWTRPSPSSPNSVPC